MTTLRMFAWVIVIGALGGEAADLVGGGPVRKVIGWFTPMAIGVVMGLWVAGRSG